MMSFSNEKEEKRRHLPPPHRSCLGVCTSPARELYTWLLCIALVVKYLNVTLV